MIELLNSKYNGMVEQVDALTGPKNTMEHHQRCLNITIQTINDINEHIAKSGFPDQETEIYYFKNVCPYLLAELYFHQLNLKRLSLANAGLSRDAIRQDCQRQLKAISRCLKENHELTAYKLANRTHRDAELFVKQSSYMPLLFDDSFLLIDHPFITASSLILGRCIAYYRMKGILKSILSGDDGVNFPDLFPIGKSESPLQWTSAKVNLVELAYALHHEGYLNGGKADINQIMSLFESMFGLKVANYYDIFNEIKQRKTPTQFLRKLEVGLNRKIEDSY